MILLSSTLFLNLVIELHFGGGGGEKMHDTANNTFFIHRQQSEGKKTYLENFVN